MTHNYFQRISFVLSLALVLFLSAKAQAPAGYYADAKGKKAAALKTALSAIIDNHTVLSYKALWECYKTTDVRADGKIWDMYSSITNFTPGTDQAGTCRKEGDAYNREHSFPKSWFSEETPMLSDLFHIVPTDGWVNSMRSNLPFGETNGETNKSSGGFSKKGACTVSGYTGTVFEPNDEYKGDFARIYFYMATRYENQIANWDSPMLSHNSYTAYAPWALEMLLRWAAEDPVSEKEINRNNKVFGFQKNRNPYVDFPGLEQYVWGTKTTETFDPDNYEGGNGGGGTEPEPVTVAAPTFSPAAGVVADGSEVTISTATEGASVYYTINGGELLSSYAQAKVIIHERTEISAYAQLGTDQSKTVKAVFFLPSETPEGENLYTLVTATDQLHAGGQYLVVAESDGKHFALGAQNSDIRGYANVTVNGESITTAANGEGEPYALLLGGQSGAWTLYDQVQNVYLALTSAANKFHTATSATSSEAQWTITISSDATATIRNNKYDDRMVRYNAGSPRFAVYKTSLTPVSLYALTISDSIDETLGNSLNGFFTVYTAEGRYLRSATGIEAATAGLPAGVYLINGKKVIKQ